MADTLGYMTGQVEPEQGILGGMRSPGTPGQGAAANQPAAGQPATVTPFGAKSSDVFKSSFDPAEERKSAWDLLKGDTQTSFTAFALSMLANNDGKHSIGQLVGQAGLDALTAVQTKEKMNYERRKAADDTAYTRFQDQRTHDLNLRKQDETEQYHRDESERGWAGIGVQRSKEARENALLQRKAAIQGYLAGGTMPPISGVPTGSPSGGPQGRVYTDLKLNEANNNPGNIIAGKYGAAGDGGRFARFDTTMDGWKALDDLIQTNYKGLTPAAFVEKYAPASDGNDTAGYTAQIMRDLGITDPNAVLDVSNPQVRAVLMRSIARREGPTARFNMDEIDYVTGLKQMPEGYKSSDLRQQSKFWTDGVQGTPVIDKGGIVPTDTTGAPRVGQKPAIPGAPNPEWPNQQLAELEARISAPEPAEVTRAREVLKVAPDAETRASAQDIITNYQRQREDDIRLFDAIVKRRDKDPNVIRAAKAAENLQKLNSSIAGENAKLRDALQPLRTMRALLSDPKLKTGALQEKFAPMARWMTSLGVDPASFGLSSSSTYEQFNNLVMRRVFDELALQKGVQTEGDAQRAQKLWVNLGNTPEGNKWINDYAENVIRNKIAANKKYYEFLKQTNGDEMTAQEMFDAWAADEKNLPSALPENTADIEKRYGGATSEKPAEVTLPDGRKLTIGRASR